VDVTPRIHSFKLLFIYYFNSPFAQEDKLMFLFIYHRNLVIKSGITLDKIGDLKSADLFCNVSDLFLSVKSPILPVCVFMTTSFISTIQISTRSLPEEMLSVSVLCMITVMYL